MQSILSIHHERLANKASGAIVFAQNARECEAGMNGHHFGGGSCPPTISEVVPCENIHGHASPVPPITEADRRVLEDYDCRVCALAT